LLKSQGKTRENLRSYRPICLLNVIGKIFEKVITNILQAAREGLEHDKNQTGLRKGKSTQDAVNKFYKEIREVESKYLVAIYILILGERSITYGGQLCSRT